MYGPLLACFIMLAGILSKNLLVEQHGDAIMKLCPQEDPVKDKKELLIIRGRDQVLEPKEVNTKVDKIGVQQFEVKQPKPQMLKACSMESVELMKNEEGAIDSTATATVQELSTQELKESKQEHERIENLLTRDLAPVQMDYEKLLVSCTCAEYSYSYTGLSLK